ncbi:MAG: hypothetical protein A2W86_13510 [Bacteroidetes bacterium GWD2_45_23]|nr:MAG: hypothetical protein A2W87_06190 [Bacteroidetes bacterium GWC2_46_850]OFX84639.1 MAG: hypothetical protein A2W86_13510 [Bacteroidetes bacterium GWD2_45_23]HBB00121.1 ABC transporter permease [Porphyromonadaceae bacterium]HCC18204.1 ABC transporter permease [Porphyromonadaceae bacterium]
MLIIRTAFKNIIGAGRATRLNIAVLSFVLVIMTAYNGMLDGWIAESRRDTIDWDAGWSQLWHPNYDKYDIFTLPDAHGKIPIQIDNALQAGMATPVLVIQASVYPQGRMLNIQLKGIDPEQQILKIPSLSLHSAGGETPVVIGKRMAATTNLKKGDRVMLRWRDRNGVFDAREVQVAAIFETTVGSADAGQMWIALDDLYAMTDMQGEATYIVMQRESPVSADTGGWHFKDNDFLQTDNRILEQSSRAESVIIFTILLTLALLAVYDTQTLSIFRRQKEIGTYVALGMTPRGVTTLFTIEGTTYSLFAAFFGAIWGAPLLYWFTKTGLPMPEAYGDIGMAVGDAMYPVYKLTTVATTLLVVIFFSALVSYLPARKIAQQNMVLALKGKIN